MVNVLSAFHVCVCCQLEAALRDGCELVSVAPQGLRPGVSVCPAPHSTSVLERTTAWHTAWPAHVYCQVLPAEELLQARVHCVLLLLTLHVCGPCRDAFGIEKSYRVPCPVLIHDDWAVAATPYHLHPR